MTEGRYGAAPTGRAVHPGGGCPSDGADDGATAPLFGPAASREEEGKSSERDAQSEEEKGRARVRGTGGWRSARWAVVYMTAGVVVLCLAGGTRFSGVHYTRLVRPVLFLKKI
jgi:hypothetical protein